MLDAPSQESLWIFGYGSLVWRPAFAHLRVVPASIDGWVRRFWQGSTDHRGMPGCPGRVVTLLPGCDPAILAEARDDAPCWGSAYEVKAVDREAVLAGLDHRERGGYERIEIDITIRFGSVRSQVVSGLMYVAHADNRNYLGPATVDGIANQVLKATGPSGPNSEYVFELASALRAMGAKDTHVFEIEWALQRLIREQLS